MSDHTPKVDDDLEVSGEHDDTGGVNVGLISTLFVAGCLFLVAFLFAMVGFFDFMAYQGRIDKVVNRASPALEMKAQQSADLGPDAKVTINQAMQTVVLQYESTDPGS